MQVKQATVRKPSTSYRKAIPVDLISTGLVIPGGMSSREVVVRARESKPKILGIVDLGVC
jgi:hypothetical protein